MKKIFLALLFVLLLVSSSYAGFFGNVLSGMTANALSGGGSGGDGNARTYFIILNKKINELDTQVTILLITNIITLLFTSITFLRQRKFMLHYSPEVLVINNKSWFGKKWDFAKKAGNKAWCRTSENLFSKFQKGTPK